MLATNILKVDDYESYECVDGLTMVELMMLCRHEFWQGSCSRKKMSQHPSQVQSDR
jgi:hypothetical protein